MQLTTLRRLLIDEIQELYIAEALIADELKRMELGASADDLKKAFQQHREQTKEQIHRLDTVCALLEVSPRGGRGISVKGLARETEDRMGEGGLPEVVDASLIAAARRVEHWEIASYGTAELYATALGETKVADLLKQTLAEEQATDAALLSMAGKVRPEDKPESKSKHGA